MIQILRFALICCLPTDVPTSDVEGVVVQLFAEAPQLVTPTGIAVDDSGRVFVAESHTHFRPDDYNGPKSDRILILEDTTGDGRADKRTIFHEGFTHVMDLEFCADGSLYVATRMDIHRLVDTDGDNVADSVTPIIRMETTGTYPHNGLSGLCFNGDGSLNFGLGENLGHDYTLVGTDGVRIRGGGEGGSTYRVAADGTGLRRITTGWWNPWGMCVDEQGRVFGTDNDPGASPPCRLIQIHDGADYGYEFRYGRTGLHPLISWTGELPGNIPMIAGTGEAPCGIISTERTNLPLDLRNDLLVACWADHRIERFDISQPEDAGQVRAERHELITGPNDFRPVGLAVASNGDIFVSDWVAASYQLHGQGRIWRISTNPRVVVSIPSKNDRIPATPAAGTIAAEVAAVTALSLRDDAERILSAADSSDPVLRHAGIMALSRDSQSSEFRQLAKSPSAAIMLAMKRSDHRSEFAVSGILRTVLADGDDDAWSVAVKWIADDVLTDYRPDLQAQFERDDLTVRHFLMLSGAVDRLDGQKPTDIPSEKRLVDTIVDETKTSALRSAALRLLDPMSSKLNVKVIIRLTRHQDAVIRIEAIRQLRTRRDADAQQRLLQLSVDGDIDERLEAIAALATVRDSVRAQLIALAGDADDSIAKAAYQTLSGADLSPDEKSALNDAAGKNQDLLEYSQRVTGKKSVRPDPVDTDAWLELLQGEASLAAGEQLFFHEVVGTCGRCHQHGGRGNAVGPSLSLIARRLPENKQDAKRWLLKTILQPGKDMAPEYTPWTIVTKDGKQLTGLPRRKGGNQEAYLGIDGKEFTVKKDDIEFHQESRTSIMPDGLLQNLTTQELRDLFAFLLGSK